jgi:nucleoside-diphosphate-sugar epimerase
VILQHHRATMTEILISGGAGFIGRHLPNKLLSQKKKTMIRLWL